MARTVSDGTVSGDEGADVAEEDIGAYAPARPEYPGRQVWVEWHLLLRVTAAVLLVAAVVCFLVHRDVYAWASAVTGVLALAGGFLPWRRQAVRVW